MIVCYGEVGVDNIVEVDRLPAPEVAVFPTSDSYHIGGAAANTAVWLAHWGAPTRLLGNAIGDDPAGRRLLEWLRAYPAVDLDHLTVEPGGTTPFCRILVTPDTDRSILIFGYPQAARTRLTPEALEGATVLALDLYGGGQHLEAARTAGSMGVHIVVCDVIDPTHPVLFHAPTVINSATYVRDAVADFAPLQLARILHAATGGVVVTTDGPDPVHAIEASGETFSVTPPTVEAVDSTGAGDVFRAGMAYGIARSWPLERSVRFATAAGSIGVTRRGAATEPAGHDEVEALSETLLTGPG